MKKRSNFKRDNGENGSAINFKPRNNSGQVNPPGKYDSTSTNVGNLSNSNFKQLNNVKNLFMKADISSEASKLGEPYAVVNNTNRVMTPTYNGRDNELGGIMPQLPRAANSVMKDVVDVIRMKMKFNYNYYATGNKSAINQELDSVWSNIDGKLRASSYYTLGFFNYSCSGKTGFTDTRLDLLQFYQTYNQLMALIPLMLRKVYGYEQHLKDMCFYEGSSIIESYYGVLRKKAFQQQVYTISQQLSKNFLDMDWLNQVITLVVQPSRKTNSMMDPLIEAIPDYEINEELTVYTDTEQKVEFFKTEEFSPSIKAAREIIQHLSLSKLLHSARSLDTFSKETFQDYINYIIDRLNIIVPQYVKFMNNMSDVLTVFERMSMENLTTWKPSMFIKVDQVAGFAEPFYNIVLEDILKSQYTGGHNIYYDPTVMKWVVREIWDINLGIPRYTANSGGAFITFSTKYVNSEGAPSNILYPVMFKTEIEKIYSRNGQSSSVSAFSHKFDENVGNASRLNAMKTPGALMIVPLILEKDGFTDKVTRAWAYETLMNIFGIVRDQSTGYTSVSKDKVCIVDILQDDVTTQIQNHVRTTSPFRMSYDPTIEPLYGFKQLNFGDNRVK